MKEALRRTGLLPPNDEFFTPECAVFPLLNYIPGKRVLPLFLPRPPTDPAIIYWEPCCTGGRSGIADALERNGNKVIRTEQSELDFLTNIPSFQFDVIITNPPYSLKDAFIKRCYELDKPWAMLMPLTALEGVARGAMFREHGVELLVLDRRVQFQTGKKGVWFNTSWFCHGILPSKLMFAELETP